MFKPRRFPRKLVGRGMVAIQVVLCLVPVLGVTAFAIDGGMMFEYRRRVQAAADAAALAAASDLYQHYSTNQGLDIGGTAKASATSTTTANGFSTDSTLTVKVPPVTGPFVGKAGYAEVTLVYNMPRGFSSILGSGALPIQARSVARGLLAAIGPGVLVLDPSSSGAVNVTGSGSLNVTGSSLVVDSTSSSGAKITGSGSITATDLNFAGSPGYQKTGSGSFNGPITSGASPTADPLASLAEPSMSSMSVQGSNYHLTGSGSATLNPGIYNGGITLTGSGSLTLTPGIYYLNGGGLNVTGSGSINAPGVMIFNAGPSGDITLTGSGSVTISPPTSGTYKGISIFQERTSSLPVTITGSGSMNLTGSIYAARAKLNVTGSGGSNVMGSQYISYDLSITGSGGVSVVWSAANVPGTRSYGLVE